MPSEAGCASPSAVLCACFRGCGVQSTSLGVQDKLVLDLGQQCQHRGRQPWAVQQCSWTVPCRGDCVPLLFVFSSSAGWISVWGDTVCRKLLVLGCFFCWFGLGSWLDSEHCWMCGRISRKGSVVLHGAGNGKEWESPCEWVVKIQLCYWNRLEEATGRGEEAATGTVLLAELMYFELLP